MFVETFGCDIEVAPERSFDVTRLGYLWAQKPKAYWALVWHVELGQIIPEDHVATLVEWGLVIVEEKHIPTSWGERRCYRHRPSLQVTPSALDALCVLKDQGRLHPIQFPAE